MTPIDVNSANFMLVAFAGLNSTGFGIIKVTQKHNFIIALAGYQINQYLMNPLPFTAYQLVSMAQWQSP